jgi:hypothetical protein
VGAELRCDNQVVVGPIATWRRETIQNSISTEYLRGQTAGLFRSAGREEPKRMCKIGDVFQMEGYVWVVVETDASGGEVSNDG